MEPLLLPTALALGFLHALEADHMAAVTTFVSRRPTPREALGFGVRWGLGHSAAILAAGVVLIALRLRLPEGVARGLEFGVGTMLLVLGGALLWTVLHERAHRAPAVAPEGPAAGRAHPHGRGSLWVGVAHGLAGTAPLLLALPAALGGSAWAAGAYLLLFGVGTTAAMAGYALLAGVAFGAAGERSARLAGVLRGVTAVASAAIGLTWMAGALGA